jgi:hypothetical protein
MCKLLQKATKTLDEKIGAVMAGYCSTFREWHFWTQEVLHGKTNHITSAEGELNPLSMHALSVALDRAQGDISGFVHSRKLAIEQLQREMPEFTFQLKTLCTAISQETGALLETLKLSFEENADIASASALISVAEVRVPFRAISDQFEGNDFTNAFDSQFN